MFNAFASRKTKHLSNSQTPFATLVKKLQESLTKMESFDVTTVAQNMDGEWIPLKRIHATDRLKILSAARPRC